MTEEEYDLNKMTRMRSAEVEKARSCKHWGIILGTLGRQGNIKLLERLQSLLKQRNIEYDVVLLSEISNATVGLRELWESREQYPMDWYSANGGMWANGTRSWDVCLKGRGLNIWPI